MPVPINTAKVPYYDIGILGAGFSGISAIYEARKRGLSAHIFDGQSGFGGTWYQNRYPGARVDSYIPIYELSIPEVYNSWTWSEKYPDWREIRKYFEHVDKVLDIKRDTTFDTFITSATFNKESGTWLLEDKNGPLIQCRIFMPLVGFASKKYEPDFPGFDKFKGEVIHSNDWPEADDYSILDNRKIGLIGTGSTGVQIVQESAPRADHLTVFQRTPNLCLPLRQEKTPKQDKSNYPAIHAERSKHPGGFLEKKYDINTFDVSPEEREKFWDSLFEKGGFLFWNNNYADLFFDEKANDEAYQYWRKRVHQRVKDPKVAEMLAPKVAPHPFGTKRPSLERTYFDDYNRDNVQLVDVNKTPIKEFYEHGIVTEDGVKHEIDLLVLATGFDACDGSFKNFSVWNIEGTQTLSNEWRGPEGCSTWLGLAAKGYPNMFFTYGPQAPTALSNGPSCISIQMDYLYKLLDKFFNGNYTYFEPDAAYQKAYRKRVDDYAETTLFPRAKSSYMGANIPGKKVQMLNFSEGVAPYNELCKQNIKADFEGWNFV
ncbi:hypothetical protein DASC09_030440 [Saccharomycopsis crataegensis]|uniref:FAD/NAD(P)-binding domain-containing protein n=1 Tax=Saccharomycopsis crataegensis TaxID=43959 RepID=A0AAV5QM53_9ASCO|nr:hypothetical protein DASC09_030440 [Saccharomycopsis crataegensis]